MNLKRLKARLAEKVKNKHEIDELNTRVADLSAIPNQLKSKVGNLDVSSDSD